MFFMSKNFTLIMEMTLMSTLVKLCFLLYAQVLLILLYFCLSLTTLLKQCSCLNNAPDGRTITLQGKRVETKQKALAGEIKLLFVLLWNCNNIREHCCTYNG